MPAENTTTFVFTGQITMPVCSQNSCAASTRFLQEWWPATQNHLCNLGRARGYHSAADQGTRRLGTWAICAALHSPVQPNWDCFIGAVAYTEPCNTHVEYRRMLSTRIALSARRPRAALPWCGPDFRKSRQFCECVTNKLIHFHRRTVSENFCRGLRTKSSLKSNRGSKP